MTRETDQQEVEPTLVRYRWLAPIRLCTAVLVGCSASQPPEPPEPPGHAHAPAAEPSSSVSLVNAAVVVSSCPDAAKMNSRQAQISIEKLVSPCTHVPGGAAHFAATLLPGGRIELGSPAGDPAEGVVPTCVLKHRLQHTVLLRKPCIFDVRLDARPLAGPPAPAPSR